MSDSGQIEVKVSLKTVGKETRHVHMVIPDMGQWPSVVDEVMKEFYNVRYEPRTPISLRERVRRALERLL